MFNVNLTKILQISLQQTDIIKSWLTLFHLNVDENQHATKRSLLVEKQKDFSQKKYIDSQPEKTLSGDGWRRTKHRVTELHGRHAKVKVIIIISLVCLVLQVTLSA